jgi:hypothetical protein
MMFQSASGSVSRFLFSTFRVPERPKISEFEVALKQNNPKLIMNSASKLKGEDGVRLLIAALHQYKDHVGVLLAVSEALGANGENAKEALVPLRKTLDRFASCSEPHFGVLSAISDALMAINPNLASDRFVEECKRKAMNADEAWRRKRCLDVAAKCPRI